KNTPLLELCRKLTVSGIARTSGGPSRGISFKKFGSRNPALHMNRQAPPGWAASGAAVWRLVSSDLQKTCATWRKYLAFSLGVFSFLWRALLRHKSRGHNKETG